MGAIIKIREITEGCIPEEFEVGDWIDLKAATTCTFHRGGSRYIPLGVAMELPPGYEAIIAARSSLFKNFGLLPAIGIGVVDESYKGDNDEWHFPVYATRPCIVERGMRICQFRIVEHQPQIFLAKFDKLGNEDRGGYGTTGIY